MIKSLLKDFKKNDFSRTESSSSRNSAASGSSTFDQNEYGIGGVELLLTCDHRFKDYNTADVLVLDDDITSRTILCRYFNKIVLRCSSDDKGRRLHVKTSTNGKDTITRLVQKKETYACVLVDNFLGPGSPSGREVVRVLREQGYENALVYVSCVPEAYKAHLLEVGGDGILFKGMANLGNELKKLVTDLTIRDKEFKE